MDSCLGGTEFDYQCFHPFNPALILSFTILKTRDYAFTSALEGRTCTSYVISSDSEWAVVTVPLAFGPSLGQTNRTNFSTT